MFGGEFVPYSFNYSFVVMVLTFNGTHYKVCTGSVFHDFLVITAAHCFLEKDVVYTTHIRIRVHDSQKHYHDYLVSNLFIHPLYLEKVENDIAIVKTQTEIKSQQLSLYFDKYLPKGYFVNMQCVTLGYGLNKNVAHQDTKNIILTKIDDMRVFSFRRCLYVVHFFTTRILCVPMLNGRGPCVGDSGSAIICGGQAIGILSRGYVLGNGCQADRKGIFIYESLYRHRVWLNRTIALALEPTSFQVVSNVATRLPKDYLQSEFLIVLFLNNIFLLFMYTWSFILS
ncbi:trypsin-3-like [Rhodnius prolixus]|uniref:trypsin-3-like n=1 Tax=Rhodnius prolixus TaxID=13249 RepID=UPI003D18BB9E